MPKYRVHGAVSACIFIGEYEADTPEEAERMANEDENADWYPTVCHSCADNLDVGDVYETIIEES